MIAEKYIKAGIITGIVLTSLTFIFLTIPLMFNVAPQIRWAFISSDDLEMKLQSTPEYKLFKEKFPVDGEQFFRGYDTATLTLSSSNKTSGNVLTLTLSLYLYQPDEIRKSAYCDAMHLKSGNRYNADEYRVKPFLEITNCLN